MNENQQMNAINEAIKKRAEKKLKEDLLDLSNTISQNRLICSSVDNFPKLYGMERYVKRVMVDINAGQRNVNVYKESDLQTAPLANMFGVSTDGKIGSNINVYGFFAKQLYDHWLPIYITREAQDFLRKVSQMEDQSNRTESPSSGESA